MNGFIGCDICYHNNQILHELPCCKNTKQVCQSCTDQLRSPYCPFCRAILDPRFFSNVSVAYSSSPPTSNPVDDFISWEDYLHYETNGRLWDWSPEDISTSRITRKQIKRIRSQYIKNIPSSQSISRRERKASRKQQRKLMRQNILQDETNFMIFEMDD